MRSVLSLLLLPTLALGALVGCDDGTSNASTADTAVAPQVTPGNVGGFDWTDMELDVHDQVNAYRATEGLPPLELDPFIGALSREHSDNMADGSVPIGHAGFDARGDLIIEDGADMVGENVAFNQGYNDPATIAVDGWLNSPPHYENIVNEYFTHAGVGIAERDGAYYMTQMFARKR